MKKAVVVFAGTVTDVRSLPEHPLLLGIFTVVTFEVNRVWKGEPSRQVTLSHLSNISESINFKQNDSYLIFGYPPPRDPSAFTDTRLAPPPPGLLQVSPCDSKSLALAETQAVMRLFGSGRPLPER
jgi:hypothetical protein